MRLDRRHFAIASSAVAAAWIAPAFAQADYPTRSVRMIVPLAPGGVADVAMRIICDQLSKRLGQTFVVETRPGAAGTIGADVIAKAHPDGYSLLYGSVGSHASAVSLYPKLPYDPVKDFTPIAPVLSVTNVMVVRKDSPVKDFAAFIALAKASLGKLNFGSVGVGSTMHLSGELFQQRTGVQMVHVPYSTNALLAGDLANGKIDLVFDNIPNALGQLQAGRLRALAVTALTRWPDLPDTPTTEELGLKDFDMSSWGGVFGPAGLPQPIVDKLNAEINAILASPEVSERMNKLAIAPRRGRPDELASLVKSEIARWSEVVRLANAR